MTTPLCDFVHFYANEQPVRLHVPGHKGKGPFGCEPFDLTEIDGADELYRAEGVIAESEENASAVFGCRTFYSAEGSSLCIRAMLYLAATAKTDGGTRPRVLAGRNAHKTFIHTAALLDLDVEWLYPKETDSYQSCTVTAADVETALAGGSFCAVYLTSPDYLGNTVDIRAIANVCHRHGVLLLVDNAHGAYLRFLSPSRHPTDLGADLCCDSAHKTLPVLTGGAYLHIANSAPKELCDRAKDALALFGSTSPSYLLLQSLDAANPYLEGHPARLSAFLPKVETLKKTLSGAGYSLCGDEPLKLTLKPKLYGYTGDELAALLRKEGVVCEYHDPDHTVLMLTPENTGEDLSRTAAALLAIPKKPPQSEKPPRFSAPRRVLSPRSAILSPCETLPVDACVGRVLACANVGCPPAVPVVVCGEEIDPDAVACMRYYGIGTCSVVKE